MGSVVKRSDRGGYSIRFKGVNGKREDIYLGKNKRQAQSVLTHVESIVASRTLGVALSPADAAWLTQIKDTPIESHLVKRGLAERTEARVEHSVLAVLDDMIKDRRMAHGTSVQWRAMRLNLIDFFGASKLIKDVTSGDCERFRDWLIRKDYAEATLRKRCQRLRQILNRAVKDRLITSNPMEGIATAPVANEERRFYVDDKTYKKIKAVCTGTPTELLLELCRQQAMRLHEALLIRWDDIDFDERVVTVRSSKTGNRKAPLFTAPLEALMRVPEGERQGRILSCWGMENRTTPRKAMMKALERAKVKPWEKLFQNMRSSRVTELLTKGLPVKDVADYAGQSPDVLWKHYASTQKDVFNKALNL